MTDEMLLNVVAFDLDAGLLALLRFIAFVA
jgi:hypothetical protein